MIISLHVWVTDEVSQWRLTLSEEQEREIRDQKRLSGDIIQDPNFIKNLLLREWSSPLPMPSGNLVRVSHTGTNQSGLQSSPVYPQPTPVMMPTDPSTSSDGEREREREREREWTGDRG
jgi:hypothetical protein